MVHGWRGVCTVPITGVAGSVAEHGFGERWMVELGCFALMPTFLRTMPFVCEDPPVAMSRAHFL